MMLGYMPGRNSLDRDASNRGNTGCFEFAGDQPQDRPVQRLIMGYVSVMRRCR